MIRRISDYFVTRLSSKKAIEQEEEEYCRYGLEILISSFLSILTVLFLGIIFLSFLETLVFLAAFISLRSYSGGYHAQTYLKCYSILNISYILCVLFCDSLIGDFFFHSFYLVVLFLCLSLYFIIRYAPVEHPNKRIENQGKKKYKLISIFLFLFYSFFDGFLLECRSKIGRFLFCAIALVGISIMIEEIRERKFNNEHEKK